MLALSRTIDRTALIIQGNEQKSLAPVTMVVKNSEGNPATNFFVGDYIQIVMEMEISEQLVLAMGIWLTRA